MPAGKSARWVHQRLSDADEKISTVFMLKHDAAKLAELEATFWAVSDPKDARYGEHLSRTQVQALLNSRLVLRARGEWEVERHRVALARTPDVGVRAHEHADEQV